MTTLELINMLESCEDTAQVYVSADGKALKVMDVNIRFPDATTDTVVVIIAQEAE